jgi:hypothetical protein
MATALVGPVGRTVTAAIWLPVGRANFYGVSADRPLLHEERCGVRQCSAQYASDLLAFQCSTMRRLLEVLPKSFGYDAIGTYGVSQGIDAERPIRLTMTLTPVVDPKGPATQGGANARLVALGITHVRLTVDEDGFYYWSADGHQEGSETEALDALRAHVAEVFGGDFALRRGEPDDALKGDEAVRKYNAEQPLGALTFFQLNTILEGLLNETLYPAVFFEDHSLIGRWLKDQRDRKSTGFYTIGSFVSLIEVVSTTKPPSHRAVLNHFLATTSREVLQRLKWSIESVRRNLLDEMLSILHRHSKLSQLNLTEIERTPIQASAANEAQLRGYIMLAAAKLPLINNVARLAGDVAKSLDASDEEDCAAGAKPDADLGHTVAEWSGLVGAVNENIRGLERAIEHAWMERLLYEQEQSRAEQEAVAEIERSRNSQASLLSADTVVNSVVLLFTVVTLAWTVQNSTKSQGERVGWSSVWVPGTVGAFVILLLLVTYMAYRLRKQVRGDTKAFDVELALRLDQPLDADRIRDYLGGNRSRSEDGFIVTPRAGVRIERVSQDSTLVKLHSILSQRHRFWRSVHFEVVNEILVHTAVEESRTVLRETRLFGDTPRPLTSVEVIDLARAALANTAAQMVPKQADLNIDDIVSLASPLFLAPQP